MKRMVFQLLNFNRDRHSFQAEKIALKSSINVLLKHIFFSWGVVMPTVDTKPENYHA